MNQEFRAFTTSTAFSISMSRGMVDCLDAAAKEDYQSIYTDRRHTPNWRALERRGLVWFKNEEHGNEWGSNGTRTVYGWRDWPWELTKAGKLMHALLTEAGLVMSMDEWNRLKQSKEAA